MKQALGFGLILFGGIMFHIAASGANPTSVHDIWQDILQTFTGNLAAPLSGGATGSSGDSGGEGGFFTPPLGSTAQNPIFGPGNSSEEK